MNKSFTLIEILVVIVVIGVLSAFILVGMNSITTSANTTKGKAFLNSLDNSLLLFRKSEWNFNNLTGTIGQDISNAANFVTDNWSSNHGTASGTPNLEEGSSCVTGKCLSFNGSTDYVSIPDPVLGSSAMTVCSWAKKSAYVQYQGIAADYQTGDPYRNWILGYENPQNSITFYVGNGISIDSITIAGFTVNKWHYICGTFDGSKDLLGIYLNNAYTSKTTSIENIGSSLSIYHAIGRYASSYYFNGLIDDVRIYSQAISSSKIKQNYYIGLNSLYNNRELSKEDFNQRMILLKLTENE